MRRSAASGAGLPPGVAGVDVVLSRSHPRLHDHLTVVKWDDGQPREPSTMMILCEQGRWKACLNDRAESRSAWVSADAFSTLLDVLEAGLESDKLDWRARQFNSPGKKR